MHPILFKVGDFPITSFGLMVCLGAIAGTLWLRRALRAFDLKGGDPVGDLVTWAVLLGLLGARLFYVVLHPAALRAGDGSLQPLKLLALWEGGLVSYGGFLGGALGAWLFARRQRLPFARLADALAPALALGQSIGRVGCLLVGDDHGRPTDLPWAITFPYELTAAGEKVAAKEGCLIPRELLGVPLHPSQVYLSLMNLALFWILARAFGRRRFDGQVVGLGMALYAVGRFGVEFTRGDDAARGVFAGLSTAQWISLAILPLALWLLARGRARAAPASGT